MIHLIIKPIPNNKLEMAIGSKRKYCRVIIPSTVEGQDNEPQYIEFHDKSKLLNPP